VAAVVTATVVLAATPAFSAHGGAPTRWCGAPAVADKPDTVSAFLVHVVYAVPADAPDRFAERVLPILSDVASIDSWWRSQDPARSPRFDLVAAACDSGIGRLDLSQVRLPHEAAYYADPRNGFERITSDLEESLAFRAPEKKYLVYYDGPVQRRTICGASPLGPARGSASCVLYLDSYCGQDLGRGGEAAATAAHELLHNLAAFPRAHPCTGDRAHACDAWQDILYPAVESGIRLDRLLLDVGRDDYYGVGATQDAWDVRESPFLEHLDAAYPRSPAAVTGLFAASRGSHVTLSWAAPERTGSRGQYRVYQAGGLLTETTKLVVGDDAEAGATVEYSVRVADAYGYLSSPRAIRVLVGSGVVDEHGAPVPDTFPPPGVTGLRARRIGSTLTLRWNPVDDPGDLAGYRVFRNGRPFGPLRRKTSIAVPAARAQAAWSVAALDASGNVGPRSTVVRAA
jgi:hypothetical protein